MVEALSTPEIGIKMAPFYPPAMVQNYSDYQKQADVKACDFKFLADSIEVVPDLPSKSTGGTARVDTVNSMLPCTSKTLASTHLPIKSIAIPSAWVQYEGSRSGYFAFHPDGNEDVIFAIYWDGYRVPGSLQHTMKNILRQPPHDLSSQERFEFWDLFPQNKARRDFSFDLLKTVVWNGRKVIETEGEWPKAEEYSHKAGTTEYCLIYDMFGNGESAGQIYLRASKEDYAKYIDKAKECMKSIRWSGKR